MHGQVASYTCQPLPIQIKLCPWQSACPCGRVGWFMLVQAPDARADKDCWLFASAAADGRVLFWDMRMTRLRFKARK